MWPYLIGTITICDQVNCLPLIELRTSNFVSILKITVSIQVCIYDQLLKFLMN